MTISLILLLIIGSVLPARAESVWLVIGASDPSPAGIARKARRLPPEGLVVHTGDCGGKEQVFAWAAGVEPTAESAKAALRKLRRTVPDAYLKKCEVQPGTLLAYRIPAVDRSIAEVPETAVNWADRDRVSTVMPLSGGRALVVSRYFEPAADDPLEGRRERVVLVDRTLKRTELEKDCPGAARGTAMGEYLAFQCETEQAGDHLMHKVVVFGAEGMRVKEIERCRDPRFEKPRYLYCAGESVAPEGTLKLERKKHTLY